MITTAILAFFLAVVQGIWGLLPAWNTTLDTGLFDSFAAVWVGMDSWVPVAQVVQMMSLYGVVMFAMVALKWGIKMLGLIRGGG